MGGLAGVEIDGRRPVTVLAGQQGFLPQAGDAQLQRIGIALGGELAGLLEGLPRSLAGVLHEQALVFLAAQGFIGGHAVAAAEAGLGAAQGVSGPGTAQAALLRR
ncbi:hypothetical protein FQZ97_790700 [compost metagenome]